MLLFQGAESFRLFTGFEAPIGVMEKALNEALR
jgi:shikimate 5-dehydrogenase